MPTLFFEKLNMQRVVPQLALLALPLLISACTSYRNVEYAAAAVSLPPMPTQFAVEGRLSEGLPTAQWWAQLQDPLLDNLIQTALSHNKELALAQASLAESRALLNQARTTRLPTLNASVMEQRQKLSAAANVQGAGSIVTNDSAGLDTAWEVDLFTGRLGGAVKAGQAHAAQQVAELQAAQVSVAAEVVSAYVSLRGSQYQIQVAERNVAVQQQTSSLTQTLDEIGQGDRLDVARAQAQLSVTQSRLPALHAAVQVALNRLGVLTGQGVESLPATLLAVKSLPNLPASVAVGNPQQLLQQRPDLRRAEAALQESVARYNIAVSDLYPRIVFTGSLGYLASDWSELGTAKAETFSFAPMLQWGGLNYARVQARIAAADARTQGQVAAFEQQVLLALEETDNAMQRFTREEQRRLQLLDAAQASTQAADYARQRFELGSTDFLSVLAAQRSQFDVDAELAQSETQLLLNLVGVYKALGGGWTVVE